MQVSRKAKIAAAALAAIGTLAVTGCNGKIVQPFNDSAVSGNISGPAEIGNMPDGFSNWSEKCDGHGFRVFIAFHGNRGYAAIAAVPDPSCK